MFWVYDSKELLVYPSRREILTCSDHHGPFFSWILSKYFLNIFYGLDGACEQSMCICSNTLYLENEALDKSEICKLWSLWYISYWLLVLQTWEFCNVDLIYLHFSSPGKLCLGSWSKTYYWSFQYIQKPIKFLVSSTELVKMMNRVRHICLAFPSKRKCICSTISILQIETHDYLL